MKNRLIGNPDLWLCHECGDCTVTCPRGVQPSVILAALRQINYLEYSTPRFLTRWLNKPVYLPVIIAFPVLIILLILWLAGTLSIPEGPVDYSKFFPHAVLNGSFSALVLLVMILFLMGFSRFIRDIRGKMPSQGLRPVLSQLAGVLKEIMLHSKFSQCTTKRSRSTAHLLIFYGFVILLAVTLVAIINVICFEYPMALWHPAKIAGNIGGLMLITGVSIQFFQRIFQKKETGRSTFSDWSFLVFLFLLAMTGMLTEWARFGNWPAAYFIYFIHLVLVWMVVIYAPYTKFVHVLFRVAVLLFSTPPTGRPSSG
jgi:quinone-modifying oxidoreductase subunit QmoC